MSEVDQSSIEFIRVFKGQDDQYYYEGVAANNENLFTSEGYTAKHNAIGGAVRAFGTHFEIRDETLEADDGEG